MKTAGLVLDFYDDVDKSVMKRVFPKLEDAPPLLKTAAKFYVLSPEEQDVLRDEAFALVMHNDGAVLRKFACVDPGNTALSVLYFTETHDELPEAAVKVAAANLLKACEQFALQPPAFLKQAAAGPMRRRDQAKQPLASQEADWYSRTNIGEAVQGSTDAGKVMSSAPSIKTASVVDVSGHVTPFRTKRASAPTRTALGGKYPLDSYGDVARAVDFFDQNVQELDPAERHEFCVKTAARARELGIEVSPLMERYGSTGYAPDLDGHLSLRREIDPEHADLWNALREKRASIPPERFAQLLREADEATNLDWYWGGQVSDPYLATFGGNSAREKIATWRYSFDGGEITGEHLTGLDTQRLAQTFNPDLAQAFAQDPITIFESLPSDAKTIIARLAIAE
jgi:hypothetical protein